MGNGRGTIDWLITHSDAFDRRWVQQSVRYSSVSFSFWIFLSFVFLYDVLKPQSSSTNLFGFELMAVVVWVQLSERTDSVRPSGGISLICANHETHEEDRFVSLRNTRRRGMGTSQRKESVGF